jgi:hypothetical protein
VWLAATILYRTSLPLDSDGLILGNDVVPYATQLARGSLEGLCNAHHLAFHPLAWIAAQGQALAAGRGGDLTVADALAGQIWISALGGATAVALLFGFARALLGLGPALALTAAYATAAGNWLYASVGETYLPATAAQAGLLVCALRMGSRPRAPHFLPVALWLTAACLLRQDSVLVCAALPLLLRWRTAAAAVTVAGLATLSVYGLAFALCSGPRAQFLPWLRGLADSGLWGTTAPGWFEALVGVVTLQHALGFGVRYGAWATASSLLATACLVLAALPGRNAAAGAALRRPIVALLAFALLRHGFFTWWQAGNVEYHTGTLLPLFLAAVLGAAQARPPRWRATGSAALAALLLATSNGLVLVLPNRATELADQYAATLAVAGEGPLVISTSALQHYAALRAAVPDVPLLAPFVAAQFAAPEELRPVVEAAAAHLARGRAVVVLRDAVLPRRLAMGELRLAPEFLTALAELGAAERRVDQRGEVYGLLIRPRTTDESEEGGR